MTASFFLLLFPLLSFAQMLSGSIPDSMNSDEKKLMKELDLVLEHTLKIQELPSQRAVHYVIKNKLDFYYPVLLPLSNVTKKFDFAFSEITVSSMVYAVYVNRNNRQIAVHNLQDYLIEGESAHVDFFDFHVSPSNCAECSFKKVESSRIGGFIYPALEGDKIIKKLNLKQIDSYYFDTYEIKFALPLNKQHSLNSLLTKSFKKMQDSKSYNQIYIKRYQANKLWKPTRN